MAGVHRRANGQSLDYHSINGEECRVVGVTLEVGLTFVTLPP